MTRSKLALIKITSGKASRYIKPRWLVSDNISTEAFDLREGTPPETYVSHFMVEGKDDTDLFKSAYNIISTKITKCHVGTIALLDVPETLALVNDEEEPFIDFIEQGLPHCGLIYVTRSQEDIQEAKATLCFLARKKMRSARDIADNVATTEKLSEK
jgi:hypothetical protein